MIFWKTNKAAIKTGARSLTRGFFQNLHIVTSESLVAQPCYTVLQSVITDEFAQAGIIDAEPNAYAGEIQDEVAMASTVTDEIALESTLCTC